jgi:hypothetical protein
MKRIKHLGASVIALLFATTSIAQGTYFPDSQPSVPTIGTVANQTNQAITFQPQPPAAAAAVEVRSIASGNWTQPWVWDCTCIPNDGHDVIISTGHTLNLANNASVNHLVIEAGATFGMSSEIQRTLIVRGDFSNEGSFTRGIGIVNFAGEDAQQVNGINAFHAVVVNSGFDLTLNGTTDLYDVLTVQGGSNVNTNDVLNLRSSGASKSGSIAALTDGTLTGAITYERTVSAAYNGWLTIGAPLTDATVGQWNDDFVTTGFVGSDYPSHSFVSIRTYDESADNSAAAFVPVLSSDDPIEPGLGYYVYANSGTYIFDVTGAPVIGEFDLPIYFTGTGEALSDGMNVLANPYPSNVSWDAEGGWVKENVLGAIYVWDVSLNQFRTYSNGYGVNGGSPLIRSGEAFWIQSYAENPVLTINENAKVAETTSPVNTTNEFLKLRISGLGLGDEMIIALADGATTNFDTALDAYKYYSGTSITSIASRSEDDISLAINHIPYSDEAIAVPIILTSTQVGPVVLTLENVPNITDRCMYIEDLNTGLLYPVSETETIEFFTDVVNQTPRFMFHVTPPIKAEPNASACNATATGSIAIEGVGAGPWSYFWLDGDGNVLGSQVSTDQEFLVDGLSAGWYTIDVTGIEQCGSLSATVEVVEPEALFLTGNATELGCDEINTGTITVDFGGGVGDYSVLWSDGSTDANRTELEAGDYTVVITDGNGCTIEQTITIDAAPSVTALFEVDQQIVNLQDGTATVYFTNVTDGATDFTWSFGDGSPVSTDENPSHTFTQTGNFIVTLNASNEECSGVYQLVVIVEQGVGVNDVSIADEVNVYASEGFTVINFGHSDLRDYRIDVYNMLGQRLIAPMEGRYGSQRLNLNVIRSVPTVLVTIQNTVTGQRHTYKILRQ